MQSDQASPLPKSIRVRVAVIGEDFYIFQIFSSDWTSGREMLNLRHESELKETGVLDSMSFIFHPLGNRFAVKYSTSTTGKTGLFRFNVYVECNNPKLAFQGITNSFRHERRFQRLSGKHVNISDLGGVPELNFREQNRKMLVQTMKENSPKIIHLSDRENFTKEKLKSLMHEPNVQDSDTLQLDPDMHFDPHYLEDDKDPLLAGRDSFNFN